MSTTNSPLSAAQQSLLDEFNLTDSSWATDYVPPSSMGIETPLASARPNSSSTSLPNTDILQSTIASLTGATASAAQANLGSVAKAVSTLGTGTITSWLSASSANIVAVLIGLVLVAGAVWGFDTVRDTVISTAKGAAELAA